MKLNRIRPAAVLFLAGAIGATLGDLSHILSGTLAYPPDILRIPFTPLPWWDPLLLGSATLMIGVPDLLGKLPAPPRRSGGALTSSTAFLALYGMSGFLPLKTGGARDVLLAALAWAIWYVWDRSRETLLLGVAAAVSGALGEISLVSNGVFCYVNPNFLGIASWIPWLYFAASVPIRGLVAELCSASSTRDLQSISSPFNKN